MCYNRRMKSIVVANWKMNPATFAEAKKLFDGTRKAAERCAKVSLVVAPPSIYLRDLAIGYRGAKIPIAVQHANAELSGAFTGEISLAQAKDAGASHVIIGHAERRALGETNDDTRKKVAAALAQKMTPILCVGEKTRTHSGEHLDFVREQVRTGLADAGTKIKQVLIAYEPVWAIGASAAMLPRDMHEMAIFIRKTVVGLFGEAGHSTKILYGGSVDDTNAATMLRDGDVRGFLVGRACLDVKGFAALLESLERA